MGTLKAAPRQHVLLQLLLLLLLWCCFFSAVVSAESGGTDTSATDSHCSSDVHAALREMSVLLGEQKAELRNAKSQIAALVDRVKNSESQLEQMRKDQQEGSVAFSLSLETTGTGHTGPFNTGTTLVFKQVFCNVGNGYNADTGFFTAPVRGLYEFSFVLHSAGGISSLGTLRRNRRDVVSVYSTQGSHHNNASNGVSLLLEKGDVVDVFMPPNMWAFDNQFHYTTFRGHLLFRVEEESPPSPPMK